MNEHTKEPWPSWEDYALAVGSDGDALQLALMSKVDYEYARACVNALADVADPAAFVKAARSVDCELQNLYALVQGECPSLIEGDHCVMNIIAARAAFAAARAGTKGAGE